MYLFLIPLLFGFIFNSASAFTAFYSTRLGERRGRLLCVILRDVIGIPVWAIGFAMAALTSSPSLFNPTTFSSALAWLLIGSGSVIIISGMVSLRWKAAAPSMQDSLVTSGLYGRIRHPLYSGMLLQLFGLFIGVPQLSMSIACFLGIGWVLLQTRLEEIDLLQRLPAYQDYMQRVPRFIPKFKRSG